MLQMWCRGKREGNAMLGKERNREIYLLSRKGQRVSFGLFACLHDSLSNSHLKIYSSLPIFAGHQCFAVLAACPLVSLT